MKRTHIILTAVAILIILACRKLFPDSESKDVLYIDSPVSLMEFAGNVNRGEDYAGVHVILTQDLDMEAITDFEPIGSYGGGNYFCGVFDGNGHAIRNLSIVGEGEDANIGLFGSLGGTVCNLILEDCYIEGAACGAICSVAAEEGEAGIFNCAVINVTVNALYTDIIGGQYYGMMENCVIDGQGNAEELNGKLRELSEKIHRIPMNVWEEKDGMARLKTVQTVFPNKIALKLSDSYQGELTPYYSAEEDKYVFCLPSKSWAGTGKLTVGFADGTKEEWEVVFPNAGEISLDREGMTYTFRFQGSEHTAAVFLDTDAAWGLDYLELSKENFLPGIIQILDDNGKLSYIGNLEQIKGRGNDSWKQEKKGFGFKLREAQNLLGMGSAKDFVLLPGYRDASLLSYQVVWDLCREMEWEYALESRFVQLYINGEYRGLYFMTEKMEAGELRIPIRETGRPGSGYLFELDNVDCADDEIHFETDWGNTYIIKAPVIVTAEQVDYCRELWNDFENALYSEDGCNEKGGYYTDYMDVDSLAVLWMFYELNGEYSVASSVFFYKDAAGEGDGRLHALYPWDVEHSFANMGVVSDRMLLNTAGDSSNKLWIAMASHEDFSEKVREKWEEMFLPALEKLLSEETGVNPKGVSSLSYYGEHFGAASAMNELLWGEEQSLALKEEQIRYYLTTRIPYLNENLGKREFFRE